MVGYWLIPLAIKHDRVWRKHGKIVGFLSAIKSTSFKYLIAHHVNVATRLIWASWPWDPYINTGSFTSLTVLQPDSALSAKPRGLHYGALQSLSNTESRREKRLREQNRWSWLEVSLCIFACADSIIWSYINFFPPRRTLLNFADIVGLVSIVLFTLETQRSAFHHTVHPMKQNCPN